MRASREECLRKIGTGSILLEFIQRNTKDKMAEEAMRGIVVFLQAYEKRLPMEAALERDAKRRKTKKGSVNASA